MAAGFKLYGHMFGCQAPMTQDLLIMGSEVITLGDAVDMDTLGCVKPADDTDYVYGIVVGLVGPDGTPLSKLPDGDVDGTRTGNAGQYGSETYTAASDNTTDKKIKARVIADPFALFMNDTAGSIAQADVGQFFDLLDEDQLKDQDGHLTAGAFQLVKLDPDGDADASKGLFRIAEWQGFNYAQR